MSMVTYPLNNIEYTAEDAELFHSTRTSGVYATDSFDYSVTSADNSIVIGTGIAWIKNRQFSGKVVAQKEPMSLDMGLPDPTYPRIDAVVIQFNSNKNATEIVVKNGAASSFPIAPEVVRTESLYELHLYHVRREAGSLSISEPNITDLRNNNAYCGLMSDSITQAVDSTLSKNGVAADAAAVGNALAKKAPAGYGLGIAEPTKITDCNTATKSGWYRFDHPTANAPINAGGWLQVSAYSADYVEQTYYNVSAVAAPHGVIACRFMNAGTWTPWEFLNPPMVEGVEYRTTERWNGKVVYTILANIGALPNSANANATINCTGAKSVIRDTMTLQEIASGRTFTGDPTLTYYCGVNASGTAYCNMKSGSNLSAYNGIVQLWYTRD